MSQYALNKPNFSSLIRGPVATAVSITVAYVVVNILLIDHVIRLVKSAANPFFAIFIIAVTIFGQLLTLFHIHVLVKEIKCASSIERNAQEISELPQPEQQEVLAVELEGQSPRLAATRLFSSLLTDRNRSQGFELPVLRGFLDTFQNAIQRRSTLPQYIANTLIGLGLFGTFLGLIVTLKEVAGLIGLFSVGGSVDSADMMGQFFQKMSGPLGGMGEAFVASLFGLGGSMVNGFQILALKKLQTNAVGFAETTFFELSQAIFGPPNTDEQGKSTELDVRVAQLQLEEISSLRVDIGKQTDAILIAASKMRQASHAMDQTMQLLERIATQEEIRPRFEQLAVVLEQRLDTLVRKLDDSQMVHYSLLNVTKEYAERIGTVGEQAEKIVQQTIINNKELSGLRNSVAEYSALVVTSNADGAEKLQNAMHSDLGVLAAAVAEVARITREQNQVMGDMSGYAKQTNLRLNAIETSANKAVERIQPQIVELIARLEKNEQTTDYVAKYDWGALHNKVDKLQASLNGAGPRTN